jgi:hypothetical protein
VNMRQYVCWHEASVLSVTPRDAVTLSPAAFQAIHHPLRLRRRPVNVRSGGDWTSENGLLDVMRGPLRPDGFLFVPIVGGSGTGKSHLVRWAREHLENTDGWEVRYLPKNRTSIRRVLEEVIRGLHGPAIDSAREALVSAPASTESVELLAERLLDELAVLISQLGDVEDGTRSAELQQFIELRRHRLVDVLRDPVVRRRLTSSGSVIPRLVQLAMTGRKPGDGLDDDAVHVSAEDLPLEFEELGSATKDAAEFLTKMKTIPLYLEMAVQIINDVLPTAVRRVFVSGQIDLVDVFRDVRRALLEDGRELALFIEDLTVLHGVEREFLDAIVEPARSAGTPVMAELRVMFAVTEGHFDGLDTVRTRCDEAFWLDAPYDDEGVSSTEAISFVGRYLNASRQTVNHLADSWEARQSGLWPENACSNCGFQESCHAAFGTSAEGFGLYPFNAQAIDNIVRSLSADRFDPRRVVDRISNNFMLHASRELQRGEFPSPELLRPFNESDNAPAGLDPVQMVELRTEHPRHADRLAGVLRYWRDEGWPGSQILGAFELPDVSVLAVPKGGKKATARTPHQSPVEIGPQANLKPPDRRTYDALADWANDGADLSQGATNALRQLVHALVDEWLQFGPEPLNLGAAFDRDRFDQERHISLEGSVSQQYRDSSMIRIERSAENATVLQALLLLKRGAVSSFDQMPGSGSVMQLAAARIEEWSSVVNTALASSSPAKADEAVQALLVISRALACDQDAKDPEDLLAGILRLRHLGPSQPADRGAKWMALVAEASRLRPSLVTILEVEFGEARGRSGGLRAIRGDRLLGIIEPFCGSWQFRPQASEYSKLANALTGAVETEWVELTTALTYIDSVIERDRPILEQIDKCLEALAKAFELGRLVDADELREIRLAVKNLPSDAERLVRELRAAALPETSLQERFRICAGSTPATLGVIKRVLRSSDDLLTGLEQDIAVRQRQASEALDATVVIAGVLAGLDALRSETERIAL